MSFRHAALLVLIVAAALRFWALDARQLHHDEGVNGFFQTGLVRSGEYRYDPTNYHGPTLYYLTLPFVWLLGLETVALRATTAVAGLLSVAVLLATAPVFGRRAALFGAALLAASPGAVYYARYFIHESLVVLFGAGLVVAALRASVKRPARELAIATASAALLFATKETALAHVAVFGLAALLAWAAPFMRSPRPPLPRLGRPQLRLASQLAALFLAVNVAFFSSFFTHARGVVDALSALAVWTHTGQSAHVNPWYRHAQWLWEAEPLVLGLGVVGGLLALVRRDDRRLLFVALWGGGILAAYSIVPYKTPWLGLNVVLPAALLGGVALDTLVARAPHVGGALAALALGVTTGQGVSLSFFHYDDESRPYVYAHTSRSFLTLVAELERAAAAGGRGTDTPVAVVSTEHWPLPWYLRHYPRAGFWSEIPTPLDHPIVVAAVAQDAELARRLGGRYERVGQYALRPGVELVLWVRRPD